MRMHRKGTPLPGARRDARVRAVGAAAAAFAVIAGLTGCAGSGGAEPAASGSTARAATAAPASPAAGSSSAPDTAAAGDFPCNVFTLGQISAATGYHIVRAQPVTAAGDPTRKSCEWADAQQHSFGVIAASHDGQRALQIFSQVENTGAAITGFGDAAWGNQSEIGVVFGDAYVQVADDSDATDENATLANVGISRLEQMATAVHEAMH